MKTDLSFLENPKSIEWKEMSKKVENKTTSSEILDFPTNLFKLNSIFVGNVYENYNQKKFRQMFQRFGRIIEIFHPKNKSFAFVHFDNHLSPINAIANYNNKKVEQISRHRLRIAFTPFKNQRESYYKMSNNLYKLIVNKSDECHYWRSGEKCPNGSQCPFKHLKCNRNVDPIRKRFFKSKVDFEKKRKPNKSLSTTKQIMNALRNLLIA